MDFEKNKKHFILIVKFDVLAPIWISIIFDDKGGNMCEELMKHTI